MGGRGGVLGYVLWQKGWSLCHPVQFLKDTESSHPFVYES